MIFGTEQGEDDISKVYRTPMQNAQADGVLYNMKQMRFGGGTSVVKTDSKGFFIGSNVFSSAPFSVDYYGNLKATNANITGVINATSGVFTGTIYANAGNISGNMGVSGYLDFTNGNSVRGQIYATSAGLQLKGSGNHGMNIDNNGNVNIPADSLVVYNDITSSHGSCNIYNDITSSHGSCNIYNDIVSAHGSIQANNNLIAVNGNIQTNNGNIIASIGEIQAYNDIYSNHGSIRTGNVFQYKDGSYGQTVNVGRMITNIQYQSGTIYFKKRDFEFKGGIVTSISSESGWIHA